LVGLWPQSKNNTMTKGHASPRSTCLFRWCLLTFLLGWPQTVILPIFTNLSSYIYYRHEAPCLSLFLPSLTQQAILSPTSKIRCSLLHVWVVCKHF
jgi:hypothetical protein